MQQEQPLGHPSGEEPEEIDLNTLRDTVLRGENPSVTEFDSHTHFMNSDLHPDIKAPSLEETRRVARERAANQGNVGATDATAPEAAAGPTPATD
jgi:hypothetical protein